MTEAGTRLVWVIDPKAQTVSVHRSGAGVCKLSASDELSGGDVLPGFTCPVQRLFE